MRTQGIRIGTREIRVGMRGTRVECGESGFGMRGIRVGMGGIRVGMRGTRVECGESGFGMREIRVGMGGIRVGMRGIGVGMPGTEWNRNRKKSEKKVYKIQFSFFPEIEKNKTAKFELS